MSSAVALALSVASGFIALSYEILWYRVYAMAMASRAQAFGALLGGYLLGLGAGALVARVLCRDRTDDRPVLIMLAAGVAIANVLGYLFAPIFAELVTKTTVWVPGTALLALTATGLGMVFPIVAHVAIRTNEPGPWVSHMYVANVAGSTAGVLLTGLFLLDRWSLADCTTTVAVLGLLCAGLVLTEGERTRSRLMTGLAAIAIAGTAMIAGSQFMFAHVYEKLTFGTSYTKDTTFTHVIENRSGVITVTGDGTVYGSGMYDGVVQTDLDTDDFNNVARAYSIGALHDSPTSVLMIGLGSGSWTQIIANHALVERVTVVEINPGYLNLLPMYPSVASLAGNGRVRFEIADGRRWLQRHPDEKFDIIVANTTLSWRSNSTSLLSVEFLELVRQHLRERGVYYYNTSQDPRVQRTGATTFPFAWHLGNMLAVSDTAFEPDFDRLREQLGNYKVDGRLALDVGQDAGRARLERLLDSMRTGLEARPQILDRTSGLALVTDDNMGSEWGRRRSFWRR